ncbi:MAG: class I SAM-dependent methyltransferase [Alphaproteobacteria bacterium]|nr:class I SAM-dependent methyltransferase [Alphaproteobacteria bacterium]
MFHIIPSQHDLLESLPKHAVVAEIGVAEGNTSRRILDICAPRALHLIDAWRHQPVNDGGLDPNNLDDAAQERRFAAVQQRFAAEIAAGQVTLHRVRSQDAAARFADGQLDWIYVDGSHLYDDVLADLRLYAPKLKPDGYIYGDDHVNSPTYRERMKFGVVEAVRQFLTETGYELVVLTNVGRYLIAKNPKAPDHVSLMLDVLDRARYVQEIRQPMRHDLRYEELVLPSGKAIVYLSV